MANYAILAASHLNLNEINENFTTLASYYPILTLLWFWFLTLLNFNDFTFWSKITNIGKEVPTINQKIVRRGSVILLCDYMVSHFYFYLARQ